MTSLIAHKQAEAWWQRIHCPRWLPLPHWLHCKKLSAYSCAVIAFGIVVVVLSIFISLTMVAQYGTEPQSLPLAGKTLLFKFNVLVNYLYNARIHTQARTYMHAHNQTLTFMHPRTYAHTHTDTHTHTY